MSIVSEVAAKCLEQAGGDWVTAATAMRARIENDPALRNELLEPLIDGAVWTAIRLAAASMRRRYCAPQAGETRGLVERGERQVAKWMAYPLPGGMPLGEARKADLADAIEQHRSFAESNALKAKWLEMIRSRVRGDRKVADVLGEVFSDQATVESFRALTPNPQVTPPWL